MWKVTYRPLFEGWHPKSCPRVVDEKGIVLLVMPQSENVDHPGEYDADADALAQKVVCCYNLAKRLLNPEELGYAVSAEVRDEAREAIGIPKCETVQSD